jgi:hypothetical protein
MHEHNPTLHHSASVPPTRRRAQRIHCKASSQMQPPCSHKRVHSVLPTLPSCTTTIRLRVHTQISLAAIEHDVQGGDGRDAAWKYSLGRLPHGVSEQPQALVRMQRCRLPVCTAVHTRARSRLLASPTGHRLLYVRSKRQNIAFVCQGQCILRPRNWASLPSQLQTNHMLIDNHHRPRTNVRTATDIGVMGCAHAPTHFDSCIHPTTFAEHALGAHNSDTLSLKNTTATRSRPRTSVTHVHGSRTHQVHALWLRDDGIARSSAQHGAVCRDEVTSRGLGRLRAVEHHSQPRHIWRWYHRWQR